MRKRMAEKTQAFVDGLLACGRHTFTAAEARAGLGTSPVAVYHSLRRLRKRGKLAMPRQGFYLIVDPEHRQLGALPPAAWIDDLMRFHRVPYYVGLLTAAAMHGASHQQPQEFQVITGTVLRPLTVGRVRVRFFFRRRMDVAAVEQRKTSSGFIPVSTPETTAYDLVRYRKGAGSVDHVATVLPELAERIDGGKLLEVASRSDELPVIQRLGYLLERTGHPELVGGLAERVQSRKPRMVPLEPGSSEKISARDLRWRVLVNTTIEVEA